MWTQKSGGFDREIAASWVAVEAPSASGVRSGSWASLVDWRGFGAHEANDTKTVSGAGCGFGGRGICLGWSLAAGRNFPGNGQRATIVDRD